MTTAPNAKLLVVGYPTVVSVGRDTKDSLTRCPILPADRTWVNKVISDLNAQISAAVAATAQRYPNRAFYVDESHAFDEHELCSAASKDEFFENGVVDAVGAVRSAFQPARLSRSNNSFHPTIAGYCAIAKTVMLKIDRLFDVNVPSTNNALSPCAHRSKPSTWWKWMLLGGGVTFGLDLATRALWWRRRASAGQRQRERPLYETP